MNITGQFRNIDNELVTVAITNDIEGEDIIIGENGLHFSREPVTIQYEADDLFEHVIKTEAEINLVTKHYVGDKLFAANATSQEVTISVAENIVFHGYIDPNTYNQPFKAGLDEFTITCLDDLSMTQYNNYKQCKPDTYDTLLENAGNISFKSLLDDILKLDTMTMIYDGSKGLTQQRTAYIFDDIGVNELVFLGESYDDVWTDDDILEEMMKYLNLHIIQHGMNYIVFDWKTLIDRTQRYWRMITSSSNTELVVPLFETITLQQGVFASDGTNITIDDVYNQIKLTCDMMQQTTVIENPLDKDALVSPFSGKQLYCTEYISEGSGDTANNAFNNMVDDLPSTYKESKTVDWFLQYLEHPKWKLYINGEDTISSILEKDANGQYINQWKVPKYLKEHQCIPAIFRMGNVEHKGGTVTDNEPISQLDMKEYIYISVNGNSDDYAQNTQSPSNSTIQQHSPLIEYVGATSGGVFSPVDDNTTNYIVFSGKILLQPIQWESGVSHANRDNNYTTIKNGRATKTESNTAVVPYYETKPSAASLMYINLISSENNDEGRYYTRKFYDMEYPSDIEETYMNAASMQPWTKDKNMAGFEYHYTAIGDGSYETVDKFSKVPVLECELIIGDKRLIETNIDEFGNSTFEWVKIGEEPTATYVDENGQTQTYTVTTFSLGFNPKIDDKIIGTEFNIQNTISYQMNVDATGTAIPIKRSDKVSGKVNFKIIGLINSTWNQITRRHPTFFRHTKWTQNVRFLLAHTENIIIEKFEAKIYSDNSKNDVVGKQSKDLVYCSDETDRYIVTKDDIDFKLMTQLSSDECRQKGIEASICMNAVTNELSNEDDTQDLLVTKIYSKPDQEAAKAEELYINEYYNIYKEPKMKLEADVHDNGIDEISGVISNVLGKTFFITGMTKDLRRKINTLKMHEI